MFNFAFDMGSSDIKEQTISTHSRANMPWYLKVWDLYYDGFRNMTVGKSLWLLIIIKLFVFFVIMKWLFFPNILKENYDTDEERADAVRTELTSR